MVDINNREDIKEVALKYADVLKKNYKLSSLYIYGSYAKENYTADSDIDIAVVAENFTGDLIEDTFQLMRLRRKVDYRIEPHPFMSNLFNEDNPEAREVIKTGIRVI